ncbi:MAG: thioredoxin family protein [Planctomycetia bacterium]
MRPNRNLPALVLMLTGLFAGAGISAEEISWSTDIEQSLQDASQSGKPVLMQFTASWCVYCKRMEKNTFTNEDVAERIGEDFVAVKVDADEQKDLIRDLEIKGLPAILIVSPDLQVIHRISGFQTAEALMTELNKADRASAKPPSNGTRLAQNSEVRSPGKKNPAVPASIKPAASKPVPSKPAPAKPASEVARRPVRPVSRPIAPRDVAELPRLNVEPELRESGRGNQEIAGVFDDAESEVDAPPKTPRREGASGNTSKETAAGLSRRTAQKQTAVKKPAFGGMSLVSAVKERTLTEGSPDFQIRWRDHLLYFASQEELKAFRAEPEKYWPMLDGSCAVTMLRTDREVEGKVEFAAMFRKQVWLFASEEEMREFVTSPADIADDVGQLSAK